MLKLCVSLMLALLCAATLASPREAVDEPDLNGLIDEFLAAASVADADMHRRFWAEDLVYTSAAGKRFGKAELLAGLQPPAAGSELRYSAVELHQQRHGDTIVISFRLLANDAQGAQQQFLNTGVFVQREAGWQAVAWQATRAAAEETAP